MTEIFGWILIGNLTWMIVASFCMKWSYQNGVADGYGYSREPNNPLYQKAGEWLRKNAAHRWMELR